MPFTPPIELTDRPDMETGKEEPALISPTSLRFVVDASGAPVIAQVLGPVRRPEGELADWKSGIYYAMPADQYGWLPQAPAWILEAGENLQAAAA